MPETTMSAVDALLFVGLPYLALAVLVGGSILRYRRRRFTYTARSSQFLESRALAWGTLPFHVGIVVLFFGHLIPVVAPGPWRALTAHRPFLLAVEVVGVAVAILALFGLVMLLARRLGSARLQTTTTALDLVLLVLLAAQVAVGLAVALGERWGAAWSVGTTTPYLWSLVTLRPDPSLVAHLPPMVKLHLVGAWVIFLLVPFSRLVHLFSFPLAYLARPPQRVLWARPAPAGGAVAARRRTASYAAQRAEERRHLLRGLLGVGAASVLLSVGVLGRLARYFQGPEMTLEEETRQLRTRLERLELTAEERELQLERLERSHIRVASLAELSPDRGRYFIDYRMRPALAFLGDDGLPLLISAKCTHLGCTVASEVEAGGRLLCPCHVSYFDLRTGRPEPGSPAEEPLPHIGWVLRRPGGEIVASKPPGRPVSFSAAVPAVATLGEGSAAEALGEVDVWIAREFAGEEV